MTTLSGAGNGSHRPPTGAFPVASRLFRGYGPVAVLVLVVALVSVLVPSRVSKNANAATGNYGAGGGASGPAAGTAGAGGAAAGSAGSAAAGTAGKGATAGSAGGTVTLPGKTQPCSGQALQIPGDPYSPPCITFQGSNGGPTGAPGVSGTTINVTVRLTTDQSFQQTLATLAGAQLRDTNADNQRTIQALAQYFNTHFQFYGRKLNIQFFTGQGSLSNELQGYGQAQAVVDAKTAQSMGSFADLSAESEPYATALWNDGILGFGDPYMPNFWHQQHAPYDWSLATDGTDLAHSIGDYAVKKLCPQGTPAAYAGGSLKGAPRKFAGIAPQNELYQASAQTFKQDMNAHGCAVDNFQYALDLGTESQQAANLVAQLKAGGYTTVICGCDPIFPVYLSGQAAQQGYFPEFIEIGAALVDQDYVGQLYNQQFYAHALGISPNEATVPYTQTIGYAAYKTVRQDEPAFFVDIIYLQMEMLAIGIQMAGPGLTAKTFQDGMYAYPPRVGPAGLWGFGPNQHTTPNDFREVCWSPSTVSPNNNKPGAYVQTSTARWTTGSVPSGPPACPAPAG